MAARHVFRWLLAGGFVSAAILCTAMAAGQATRAPLRDITIRAESLERGAIAGRIVNAEDGRPLRRVQVRAEHAAGGEPRTVVTDDEGRYQLSDLRPGQWTVSLSKAGYVRLISGQRKPGSASSPLTVKADTLTAFDASLVQGGAITGMVVDEQGDPVAGTVVQALRARTVNGQRRLTSIASDLTDDTGAFRLHSLAAGDYYVKAQLRAVTAEQAEMTGSALPTFFPGTANIGEARRVTLRRGEERGGANFSLQPARALRISGVVTDAAGHPADEAEVQLLDPTDGTIVAHPFGNFGLTHDGGHFTMLNVSPGSYLIAAIVERPNREPEKALTPIVVSDGDTTEISLATAPAATITGTVASAAAAPLPRDLRAQIKARSAYGFTLPQSATLTANQPFALAGVSGVTSFTVDGLPKGWAVERIEMNGADVTDGTIDIRPTARVTARVTLTNRTTRLDGTVSTPAGAAAGDQAVLVFASNAVRWTSPSRFVATVRSDARGRFTVEGLPPGDYLAAAPSDFDDDDTLDAELLFRVRRSAATVTLVAGAPASVSLTTGADR